MEREINENKILTNGAPRTFMPPCNGNEHTGLAKRRKSAQLLAPLILNRTNEPKTPKCTPEQIHIAQAEGSDAYGDFLRHRLYKEQLQEPWELTAVVEYHKNAATTALRTSKSAIHERFDETDSVQTPVGSLYPQWGKAGRELDKLAASFEKTHERRRVRQKAEEIALTSEITKEKFLALLSELFSEGRITSHRIVVLFVFCSDVVITALRKKGGDLLTNFLHWIFDFITEKVCSWVAENGGWDAVLCSTGAWILEGMKFVAAGFLIYLGFKLAKSTVDRITSK